MSPNETTNLIEIAVPILVPLIIALEKKVIDRIPAWARPLVAGLIGPAMALLAGAISHAKISPGAISAIGLAGVGLREVVDQGKQLLTAPLPEAVKAQPTPADPPHSA